MKQGDYVHYTNHGKKENGRVKSVEDGYAFVVYHCGGDWDNFRNYTGARTETDNLSKGWVDENGRLLPQHCDHHYIPTNAKWQSETQRQCVHCGHIID